MRPRVRGVMRSRSEDTPSISGWERQNHATVWLKGELCCKAGLINTVRSCSRRGARAQD